MPLRARVRALLVVAGVTAAPALLAPTAARAAGRRTRTVAAGENPGREKCYPGTPYSVSTL
ncbi:hypothetical protein ACFWPQ_37455 [Streptomyces sp. NPDC058464]|uniref:hypothetical protein n=1 Tax=Streptomyces sp. NPDC058464 TaxID=3346511 RepID=UPI003661ED70